MQVRDLSEVVERIDDLAHNQYEGDLSLVLWVTQEGGEFVFSFLHDGGGQDNVPYLGVLGEGQAFLDWENKIFWSWADSEDLARVLFRDLLDDLRIRERTGSLQGLPSPKEAMASFRR